MMASSHIRVVLAVMVAIVILSVLEAAAVAEDTHVSKHCKREQELMVKACEAFAAGQKSPESCCRRVRSIKKECVCPYLTPSVVAKIGAQRLIELIKGCGRVVPHHAKCGSLTFP